MSIRAQLVTLEEFIECAVKVGLTATEALTRAREQGWRVDNNTFFAAYRAAKERWQAG